MSRIRGSAATGLALAVGMIAAAATAQSAPTTLPDDFFDALEYRHIGPVGNRVIAVAGVPGDPNVYYAGAASGGIFKSADGGHHWKPIFDDQPASSIGSLAIAPSDPNVVWAGTGETFLRANISIGNGIYRSTDAGETWQHRGLESTGRIGRVVIDPTDPEVVFAAALGHCYGPQPERGIYRTTDGGMSWQRVLFVDENTGASDLVMDPNNPRILFAGMWEVEINTWSRRSGGPGSGLHTSRDGGESWTRLEGEGLPEPPWGKVGLAMSADDSRRIYALIETSSNRDFATSDPFQGVLWTSDDGGETWTMTSADNNLVQRPLYYSRAAAAPDDRDEIHFMSVSHRRSLDGGHTSDKVDAGWDHHDMWIDPLQPDRMIVGHDGGVSISTDRGESWYRPLLPNAQMYHVAVDRRVPYFVYGNRQDGSTARGPSNSLSGETIPLGAWQSVGGCETGFSIPAPPDDQVVWSGCYDGILERFDLRSGHSRVVSVWPDAMESVAAEELEFRFQWTFPIAISPHDPQRVYAGSQYVHRTTDGGQSWSVISPDLTGNDPELQRRTGGLTLDDAGPTVAPSVFALAESPLEEGLIWAGTNDGGVRVSRPQQGRGDGRRWSDVTAELPDLPPRGTVSNIEPSRHEAGRAYLTVDRHQLGDTEPYVFRTEDYGETWSRIDADVPRSTFSYSHCVREDPVDPQLLYLGTENAVYFSADGGGHWRELRSNLPHAPVHWLAIQDRFHDLVVATYGRGFWILDDITPLRQLDLVAGDGAGEDPVLLAPRAAWRLHDRAPLYSQPDVPAAGANPPAGASLHYYLPAGLQEDVEVELAILDGAGEVIRTLDDLKRDAGLHRVWWDLRYDKTEEVKLRTTPDENPHIPIPAAGWRELEDGGRIAVLAAPGTYGVRLTVGERVWSQDLTLLKDPTTAGTEEDIRAQSAMLLGLRDLQDTSARLINDLEWARKQIFDLIARLEDLDDGTVDVPDVDALVTAAESTEDKLAELEGRFFDLRLTGAGQDTLRWKRLLYARLAYLAEGLKADYPPTDAQREVYRRLEQEVAGAATRFEELRQDVADLNALLAEQGVSAVLLGF